MREEIKAPGAEKNQGDRKKKEQDHARENANVEESRRSLSLSLFIFLSGVSFTGFLPENRGKTEDWVTGHGKAAQVKNAARPELGLFPSSPRDSSC